MTPAQFEFIRAQVDEGADAEQIAGRLFPLCRHAKHIEIVMIIRRHERAKAEAHAATLKAREARRRAAKAAAESHPYIVGCVVRHGCGTGNRGNL